MLSNTHRYVGRHEDTHTPASNLPLLQKRGNYKDFHHFELHLIMTRRKKYLHLPSRAENFCQNAGLKLTLFVSLGWGKEKDPGGTEPLSCNVSSVFYAGLSINDVTGFLL